MNNIELKLFSNKVESWGAERILTWVADLYAEQIVLTCSFGGGGIVLAHMLSRHRSDVPVLFLDTGFHFPETTEFKNEFAKRFGMRVVDILPELTVDEQTAQFGAELYRHNPDLCCYMRKVAPLAKALHDMEVKAWVSALRRDQSPTRQHIQVLEWHTVAAPTASASAVPGSNALNGAADADFPSPSEASALTRSESNDFHRPADADSEATRSGSPARSRQILKVHPLANWTRADVWRYIHEHELPYHPLLDAGYSSIGCAPCTSPTSNTDDERSGRWAGTGKVECGLHTFSDKVMTER